MVLSFVEGSEPRARYPAARRAARLGRSLALPLAVAFILPVSAAAQLAVAWNDEAGAGIQTMKTRSPWPLRGEPLEVGRDSVLRYAHGRLYVVSRGAGTVTIVAHRGLRPRRVLSLGANSEPEDIALVDASTAYVTRRRATRLLRLDLRSGAMEDTVDLAPFADADGIPDLGMMAVHGGRLFVQIRRFNEDGPGGLMPPGYLAVVDLASGQLVDVDPVAAGVQAIELQGTSPKHRMQVMPQARHLFVSATGGFFDAGGIEVIDLDTLRSLGLVIREADGFTGADLGPFIMVTPERGFLVYSTDFDLSSHLKAFSLSGGVEPGPELHVSVGYAVPALEHDPHASAVFVPDGVFEREGINVFDAVTGERLTPAPIATGGMPTDVLIMRTETEN